MDRARTGRWLGRSKALRRSERAATRNDAVRGVVKRLIAEAFARSGAKWLDLWAEPESEGFYRSFQHREHVGFRIYPAKPS